jgi:cation transport ATPase
MQTIVTIKGTHCPACKALIEDVCGDFQEIQSCSVDFKTGRTEIEHSEKLDWNKFRQEIESLGAYKLELK